MCQRYFTGIANIGDVSFYAGLKAALARLGVCAKLFHVSRTRLAVAALSTTVWQPSDRSLRCVLRQALILPPPGCTPAHSAFASLRQAPVTAADAMEHGSNNMAAPKKERADSNACGHVYLLFEGASHYYED